MTPNANSISSIVLYSLMSLAIKSRTSLSEQTLSDNDLISWYFKKNEKYKTLVFFHGNAGNLSNRIYKLNEFSKLNLNYLIFAYRGFNENKGKPTEEGLYKDAISVIEWLKSKNILEKDIILYGESLGAAIAVHTGQHKSFAGIILEAPFTSMVNMGQKYYPFFPVRLLLKDKYESINKIKAKYGIEDTKQLIERLMEEQHVSADTRWTSL